MKIVPSIRDSRALAFTLGLQIHMQKGIHHGDFPRIYSIWEPDPAKVSARLYNLARQKPELQKMIFRPSNLRRVHRGWFSRGTLWEVLKDIEARRLASHTGSTLILETQASGTRI